MIPYSECTDARFDEPKPTLSAFALLVERLRWIRLATRREVGKFLLDPTAPDGVLCVFEQLVHNTPANRYLKDEERHIKHIFRHVCGYQLNNLHPQTNTMWTYAIGTAVTTLATFHSKSAATTLTRKMNIASRRSHSTVEHLAVELAKKAHELDHTNTEPLQRLLEYSFAFGRQLADLDSWVQALALQDASGVPHVHVQNLIIRHAARITSAPLMEHVNV